MPTIVLSATITGNRDSGQAGEAHHTSTDRGHGRVEKRTLKVVAVSTGILFPHAVQAIQITRKTRKLSSKKWRTEVVHAVTSLTTAHATDAQLAAFIRGHWCVENRLHWVRDVTFDEDRSPGPHPQRTPRHGLPAQPRHQPPTTSRRQQHRLSSPTSLMGPTQTRRTTPDQLRQDFAGALRRPGGDSPGGRNMTHSSAALSICRAGGATQNGRA